VFLEISDDDDDDAMVLNVLCSVARAGTVGASKVLRDGEERERTSHAAVPRLDNNNNYYYYYYYSTTTTTCSCTQAGVHGITTQLAPRRRRSNVTSPA